MKYKTKENIEGIAVGLILAALVIYMLGLEAKADWYGIASVGKSHAVIDTRGGTPAWQQNGFPHHEGITDTVWSLGMGYTRSWFSIESQYHDLGSVTAYGQWGFNDNGEKLDTMTGEGGAKVGGLSLSGIGRYSLTPDISVGLEAGVFRWDSAWRMRITQDGNSSIHEPIKTRGMGPLLGMIVSWKKMDLRYECFSMTPRDGNFKAVDVLSVGYRF